MLPDTLPTNEMCTSETTTDSNGNYTFKKIEIDKLNGYYIEFEYNGMTFYGRWIILLLNLCYIMFMYKGKISKKLIYFIFVYFIFAISELVSILLLEIFNVVSAPIDVHSSTYLIVIFTTQIISYTIGFTLSKFYHDKNTIKFTYIVLIPIIFLLGIALCYKDYREILQKNQIFLNVFFFLTILIFISFLIQYGFIHNLQIKEELKLEKMENEFNAIKFDMLDRNYKSNFNFMHSLLHEITTLKNRIEKSENQAEYAQSIDAIEKIVLENFNQIYSNNIAMSVVLNEYKSKLENKHIKLSMNLPTDIFSNIKYDEQINLYLCLFDVICEKIKDNSVLSIQGCSTKLQDVIKIVFETQVQCVEFDKLFKEFSYIQTYSFEENGYFNGLIMYKK
ncbi:MAG: hypothetical protein EGQ23_01515 [Solobacterium sp.]|nr:hypothetical protein [Solobacterium sp.]